jgi:diadenosine tetraphosphate (Ap4A) HIT family hydrolase
VKINERILLDTVFLIELELCQVRLMRDELDWFMLLPMRDKITEIHQLSPEDQLQLMKEVSYISQLLESKGIVDKINIGAIGNIVSQLHIHIVGRTTRDRAWPNTIWGTKTTRPFNEERVHYWLSNIRKD